MASSTGKLQIAEVQPTEPVTEPLPPTLINAKHLLFNRELSWLEFNRRVLEEALDPTHPLLERLKFLAIFSTNLDEFFMIRVSGLMEKLDEEVVELSPDGMTPTEELKEISIRIRPILAEHMRCLQEDILPQLAAQGIVIASYSELTGSEKKEANRYFREKIFPVLTPQAVDPGHPFPYISNLSLNLGVMVEPVASTDVKASPVGTGGPRFARIKLPPAVPQLIPVTKTGTKFTFLGSLVAANADMLFPEMKYGKCYLFRVTRDADIEIREDEAGDLMRSLQQQLRRRRFGMTVRLEVSTAMPGDMREYLMTSLDLSPDDVYPIDGTLNVPDLMQLYGLDRPELKDKPLQVGIPEPLRQQKSMFEAIKQQDILLHHPYTSFTVVTEFIRTAAHDPQVVAIKMCLYRTGQQSPIVRSLMEASELGKQVAVLVELKARFDEENNMEWARQLEKAGVHVVYGLVGLKTHCKLALVVRREGEVLKRYIHLATGNYNPTSSRIYTDIGLLTANEEFGEDATNLFNYLTGYSRFSNYQRLMVAPINLKEGMLNLIEREAENARSGRGGRIIAKINSLTDLEVIHALYKASQAGVSMDLIVRGICALRPGIPGISENIRVRSIVGRFLEHSRIYYFGNAGGEGEVYIGSADWMERNLNRRVEIIAPVMDSYLKGYLREVILEAYLNDKVKARCLQTDGSYTLFPRTDGDEVVNSQTYFQKFPDATTCSAEVAK